MSKILDRAIEDVAGGVPVATVYDFLLQALDIERLRLGAGWLRAVDLCRAHPLYQLFGHDPLIQRTRAKPRGYAGDAVTLDLLYSGLSEVEAAQATPLGRALFAANYVSGPPRSVRFRRERLARKIDATAERVSKPRILSLACGHLREGTTSTALARGRIGTFSALDQDPESLALIEAEQGSVPGLDLIHGSVRDLLTGKIEIAGYDLVYTAGLYDYLPVRVSTALTALLVRALNPGGELLIGNFVADYSGSALMEAFMDWKLIGRSEAELRDLGKTIPSEEIRSLETCLDETGCIAYLELTKA